MQWNHHVRSLSLISTNLTQISRLYQFLIHNLMAFSLIRLHPGIHDDLCLILEQTIVFSDFHPNNPYHPFLDMSKWLICCKLNGKYTIDWMQLIECRASFTNLKLWIAVAIHIFKRVKITHICLIWDQDTNIKINIQIVVLHHLNVKWHLNM